jgi:hypothetical protein
MGKQLGNYPYGTHNKIPVAKQHGGKVRWALGHHAPDLRAAEAAQKAKRFKELNHFQQLVPRGRLHVKELVFPSQPVVFRDSVFVVGKKIQLPVAGQVFQKMGDVPEVFTGVIHPGHDRQAQDEVSFPFQAVVGRLADVVQYLTIRAPREFFVNRRIGMFNIDKGQVGVCENGSKVCPSSESTGLNSRVDELIPALLQDVGGKGGLHQDFTPGEGYSSASSPVEDAVLFHLLHNFLCRHRRTAHLPGSHRADPAADPTVGAPFKVAPDFSFFIQKKGLLRAGRQTGLAGDTPVLEIDEAGLRRLAERAAAPQTSERATLEKDHRANARPVLQHIFGSVENGPPPPGWSIPIYPSRLHGVKLFFHLRQPGYPFFTAEHAENAEANYSKDKIQRSQIFIE